MVTKGGARSRSGPPPDPTALRRDRKDDGEWITLSAAGRVEPVRDLGGLGREQLLAIADAEGISVNRRLGAEKLAEQIIAVAPVAPPQWPLTGATERELRLWTRLWKKPQAIEWARLGQELEVALYVRKFAEAEMPFSRAALATLVRQMGDSLGLTVPGMRANRWKIEVTRPAPAAATPGVTGRTTARSSGSRARLKVVADAVEGPKSRR